MKNRGYNNCMRKLLILLVLVAIAAIGAVVYRHYHYRASSVIQELSPNPDGSCPAGYVQYGEPLNKCVPRNYFNECFIDKTRKCPI